MSMRKKSYSWPLNDRNGLSLSLLEIDRPTLRWLTSIAGNDHEELNEKSSKTSTPWSFFRAVSTMPRICMIEGIKPQGKRRFQSFAHRYWYCILSTSGKVAMTVSMSSYPKIPTPSAKRWTALRITVISLESSPHSWSLKLQKTTGFFFKVFHYLKLLRKVLKRPFWCRMYSARRDVLRGTNTCAFIRWFWTSHRRDVLYRPAIVLVRPNWKIVPSLCLQVLSPSIVYWSLFLNTWCQKSCHWFCRFNDVRYLILMMQSCSRIVSSHERLPLAYMCNGIFQLLSTKYLKS